MIAKNESSLAGACTNSILRELARSVSRRFDAALAPAGIKATQYATLWTLETQGPMRSIDLARAMEMTESTLSRNLRPLLAAQWIRLERLTDHRSQRITLSEAGRQKIQEACEHQRKAQSQLASVLGAQRMDQLHVAIEGCMRCLREERRAGAT